MPWTARDASKHTKAAATAAKRKRWADTANAVLKSTGDEARALRTANAAVKPKRRAKR